MKKKKNTDMSASMAALAAVGLVGAGGSIRVKSRYVGRLSICRLGDNYNGAGADKKPRTSRATRALAHAKATSWRKR